MMLELYDLEKLVAFRREGTLVAASEKLLISQPALSRSMRKLEDEMGVELFTRSKNRMELNENGLLAADLAEKLLGEADSLVSRVRQLDRSRHTVSVGSVAPEPLWELAAAIGSAYPGMTVSSGLAEADALLAGVQDETYSFVVLTFEPQLPGVEVLSFGSEKLCFLLPMNHPLAGEAELRLADLNGETMLLRPNLGFWTRTLESLPDTRFLVQQEDYAFGELIRASSLPAFTTDRVQRRYGATEGRVAVPISDPGTSVDYFVAYRSADKKRLAAGLKVIEAYVR